jgi:hypothetical protein
MRVTESKATIEIGNSEMWSIYFAIRDSLCKQSTCEHWANCSEKTKEYPDYAEFITQNDGRDRFEIASTMAYLLARSDLIDGLKYEINRAYKDAMEAKKASKSNAS